MNVKVNEVRVMFDVCAHTRVGIVDVPSKPFDVDTWWKEMQAHPMFMEAGTAVGDNVSDEVAALQVRARA